MMSTTKTQHTPGPWHMVDDPDGHVSIQTETLKICTVGYAGLFPAAEADARLIAAAPEMLAALRHAANDLESRIYLLPIDADATERAILAAQRNIYGRAIALAEGA